MPAAPRVEAKFFHLGRQQRASCRPLQHEPMRARRQAFSPSREFGQSTDRHSRRERAAAFAGSANSHGRPPHRLDDRLRRSRRTAVNNSTHRRHPCGEEFHQQTCRRVVATVRWRSTQTHESASAVRSAVTARPTTARLGRDNASSQPAQPILGPTGQRGQLNSLSAPRGPLVRPRGNSASLICRFSPDRTASAPHPHHLGAGKRPRIANCRGSNRSPPCARRRSRD